MFYVYLIRSEAFPEERYIGFTTDLNKRIEIHNAGGSTHTSKYKPWKRIGYHAFAEIRRAQEFEYYLKTGSGKAFANKRLWQIRLLDVVELGLWVFPGVPRIFWGGGLDTRLCAGGATDAGSASATANAQTIKTSWTIF